MGHEHVINLRATTPLVGRLRGASFRSELNRERKIYFTIDNPHFMLREAAPSTWPDLLANAEYQIVVSSKLLAVITKIAGELTSHAVRIVDKTGTTVWEDYHLVEVTKEVACLDPKRDDLYFCDPDSEDYDEDEMSDLPGMFRPLYRSELIFARADLAAAITEYSGVVLTLGGDYIVEDTKPDECSYKLLQCGSGGAEFSLDVEFDEQLGEGQSVIDEWPDDATASMTEQSSACKVVGDVMAASGIPMVSERVRDELVGMLDGEVEFLPIRLKGDKGRLIDGQFFIMNVIATRPYADMQESDVEIHDNLLWKLNALVVDEDALKNNPPMFRLPVARYPWIFVRNDIVDLLDAQGVAGWCWYQPEALAYVSDVPKSGEGYFTPTYDDSGNLRFKVVQAVHRVVERCQSLFAHAGVNRGPVPWGQYDGKLCLVDLDEDQDNTYAFLFDWSKVEHEEFREWIGGQCEDSMGDNPGYEPFLVGFSEKQKPTFDEAYGTDEFYPSWYLMIHPKTLRIADHLTGELDLTLSDIKVRLHG